MTLEEEKRLLRYKSKLKQNEIDNWGMRYSFSLLYYLYYY